MKVSRPRLRFVIHKVKPANKSSSPLTFNTISSYNHRRDNYNKIKLYKINALMLDVISMSNKFVFFNILEKSQLWNPKKFQVNLIKSISVMGCPEKFKLISLNQFRRWDVQWRLTSHLQGHEEVIHLEKCKIILQSTHLQKVFDQFFHRIYPNHGMC